jgi:hypothetical protein
VKETCHLDFSLVHFVYLGLPSDFEAMKKCTVPELMKCIKPIPPLEGDVYNQKSAAVTKQEVEKELRLYREAQAKLPQAPY